MPTVYLKKDSGGKVLLVGGKVAIGPDCCCTDCPPPGAPMAIEAIWLMSGVVAACTDHAADIDVSAEGDANIDLDWAGNPCTANTLTDSAIIDFACPPGCGFSYVSRNAQIEVSVQYDPGDGHYYLVITGGIDGNICGNGTTGGIQDFRQDLGTDPIGDYHVEVDSNDSVLHWVFDISIS